MGNKQRFAVLGHPVQHSLSPRMHNFWLRQHKLSGSYALCPTDGTQEGFVQKVTELRAEGVEGCNVTIPHKLHAYDCCDCLSIDAERVGSVNTLIFRDGLTFGENTDVWGFLQNIKQHSAYDKALGTGQACILGAGGTSRSVLYGLLKEGFRHIVVLNRTRSKAETLIERYQPLYPESVLQAGDFQDLNEILTKRDADSLVVNTTSIGMSGQGSWSVHFPHEFFVTDVVYVPLVTPFLDCAINAGMEIQDGFNMLLYQGAESFRLWTGIMPTVDEHLRQYVLNAE